MGYARAGFMYGHPEQMLISPTPGLEEFVESKYGAPHGRVSSFTSDGG
jgi:hypothetical protein